MPNLTNGSTVRPFTQKIINTACKTSIQNIVEIYRVDVYLFDLLTNQFLPFTRQKAISAPQNFVLFIRIFQRKGHKYNKIFN